MAEDQKKPTAYESGPLSREQLYELELSSRAQVQFLQIRPAVIAEFVRAYRANLSDQEPRCTAEVEGEHAARHAQLHAMLDELVADWLIHTKKRPSSSTVLELMQWANEQRISPTHRDFRVRCEHCDGPHQGADCPITYPGGNELACACGATRSKSDQALELHIHGVLLQGPDARWLRTCSGCGSVYVVPVRERGAKTERDS